MSVGDKLVPCAVRFWSGDKARAEMMRGTLLIGKLHNVLTYEVWPYEDVEQLRIQEVLFGG
jgi:hypothetical protein